MKVLSIAFRIEIIKLFRRSNILFLFLIVYLYLTPFSSFAFDYSISNSTYILYSELSRNISIISLIVMSIFFVNSVGNDFSEGSYRYSLAIGLSRSLYLFGKILLVILISALILLLNTGSYIIVSLSKTSLSFSDVLMPISYIKLINQLIALICAGIFGLFFIVLFRNRIIGLVFFPFWASIEFTSLLLFEKKNILTLAPYLPGINSFKIYNSTTFNASLFLITIFTCILFMIIILLALKIREDKV